MNTEPHNTAKARCIMIGGFLGAGKTTAVGKLAQWLRAKGKRVGLITNDQGSRLVDTTWLLRRGFAVEEIPGGCFCCRFDSLVQAAAKLAEHSRPEMFIAEPVGSCTDLVATVTYPLRRLYGENYAIAPLSVMIDPARAEQALGLARGGQFSDGVTYIYRKQLEEADVIVINKCDLLTEERRNGLRRALSSQFPQARVLEVSARTGAGLDAWFELITSGEQTPRRVMEVDYEVYAEGEARLGWLNATYQVASREPAEGNAVVQELAGEIHRRLREAKVEVAHLKMTLEPEDGNGELAVVNLVRNDAVPELAQALAKPLARAQLIVNLRAEGEPDLLRSTLKAAVDAVLRAHGGLSAESSHLESFKPGKPQPTHRETALV